MMLIDSVRRLHSIVALPLLGLGKSATGSHTTRSMAGSEQTTSVVHNSGDSI